ncbi:MULTISPECIES: hypothetical protein [Cysteiniphilum]|uniref:Uncharacterized protein n=1 Tax=Cysteiniphilum litorale TaxID=2056700 RepID=A0A8J2Z3R2_9GAMM|nr:MULTISPECIES: hypothetical protein [Cysteiniphilum]GGF92619.1 hypothetical protein GCM10010995_07220 [Cysteiniphilum litorale]
MHCVSNKVKRHLQLSEVAVDACLQNYITCVQRCYEISGLSIDHNWKQYIECSVKYTNGHISPVRFVAYIDSSTLQRNTQTILTYIDEVEELSSYKDEIEELLSILGNNVDNNKFCLGIEKTKSGYQHKIYFYLPKQIDQSMAKLLEQLGVNVAFCTVNNYAQAIGFTLNKVSEKNTEISAKGYRVFTDFDTLNHFLKGRVTKNQLAILKQGNYVELIEKEGGQRNYVHINPKSDQQLLRLLNSRQIDALYKRYITPEFMGNTYISCWLDDLNDGEAINEFTLYY